MIKQTKKILKNRFSHHFSSHHFLHTFIVVIDKELRILVFEEKMRCVNYVKTDAIVDFCVQYKSYNANMPIISKKYWTQPLNQVAENAHIF